MRLPSEALHEPARVRRQTSGGPGNVPSTSSSSSNPKTITQIVVVIVVLVILVAISALLLTLRHLRSRNAKPKYLPGVWLKQKWRRWTPQGQKQAKYSTLQRSELSPTTRRRNERDQAAREETMMPAGETETETTTTAGAAVDRNTSVRSIMTLPAYSSAARPNERILGREGERAGIDMVVEYPETMEEEEGRREEEMESLYQIRLARRQEIAAREERRRLRREARERGDEATLEALRQESRLRAESAASLSATNISPAAMIAEHHAAQKERERRVSSVSYAELGVARHDGTRLRANSNESDRPLLDSAASIGGRPESNRTLNTRHRDRSPSSVLTVSTTGSDDFRSVDRTGSDFDIVSTRPSRSRSHSASQPLPAGGDVSNAQIPVSDPPQYDNLGWGDAPPYESPVRNRAPQLPIFETLPAIEITAHTPVDSTPPTPNILRPGEEVHRSR
ncbi:hypothetical protein BJ546DRAFT_165501 [Cryomyces antarcticus]